MCMHCSNYLTWPRGYKTLFMLNSAEHEICLANKSQILTIANYFLLNTAKHENFSATKYENANNSWHFHIISRESFMLSLVEHEKKFYNLGAWINT